MCPWVRKATGRTGSWLTQLKKSVKSLISVIAPAGVSRKRWLAGGLAELENQRLSLASTSRLTGWVVLGVPNSVSVPSLAMRVMERSVSRENHTSPAGPYTISSTGMNDAGVVYVVSRQRSSRRSKVGQ